jgi:hypothetical protein
VKVAARGSLSVDLDDEWTYRRTLGDPGWESRPSYLGVLASRLEELLDGRRVTFFAVGADARRDEAAGLLRALHERGNEIASHSDQHDLRLHRRPPGEIEHDVAAAAEAIEGATGVAPRGFRSPGYGTSHGLRSVLARRGYLYHASAFPSPAGLLARAWYARRYPRPRLRAAEVRDLLAEAVSTVRPHRVGVDGRGLLEIPITVMPYTHLPIHASHLLLVARHAPRLAFRYFDLALALCARQGVGPALVIHPTDVLDASDSPALRRFPGMDVPATRKLELARRWLTLADARFELGTVADQAAHGNIAR